MNNIELLESQGKLGDFRYYLGADSEDDERWDEEINALDALGLVRIFCGFELGDPEWANEIIGLYTNALKLGE